MVPRQTPRIRGSARWVVAVLAAHVSAGAAADDAVVELPSVDRITERAPSTPPVAEADRGWSLAIDNDPFAPTQSDRDYTGGLGVTISGSRGELQQRIARNSNLVLVEALPAKYFEDWHLPRATHLPHDQVRELAPARLPDKTAEIVVYCASETCQNSHIAARQLASLGYSRVFVYAGGKSDWSDAGLPIERGTPHAA